MIPIMSRCKDRIKYCGIKIVPYWFRSYSWNFEAPSPLRLPKAQIVEIGDLFFHRIWTNECRRLKLSEVKHITKEWCKFVIENCNCSNITTLILDRVTFFDYNYSVDLAKVILTQLALKFCNLKALEIEICEKVDDNVLLFWQLLKAIISKNKTKVKLVVERVFNQDASLLNQKMDDKNLKIDKLTISHFVPPKSMKKVNTIIKLIQERDNRGLNHLTIVNEAFGNQTQKLLDELKCNSINTFELKDDNFDYVNALLEWKMIAQKHLFVIIDCHF